jgi:hypothetical protein
MSGSRNVAIAQTSWPLCRCLLLVALVGCGASRIKTYPVKGRVEVKDGDIALLTGSSVELVHESDELLRPNGKVEPGGSFTLQTLYQGKLVPGAPEGKYKVRIILGDESDEGVPKRKGDPIHKRFLDFETSGLALTVPSGDYTVALSKK